MFNKVQALATDQEYFPSNLVHNILDGENPIKAFREYRNLSREQPAQKIGKTKQYISAIEKGLRVGTIATLRKIADELNVDLDMLES